MFARMITVRVARFVAQLGEPFFWGSQLNEGIWIQRGLLRSYLLSSGHPRWVHSVFMGAAVAIVNYPFTGRARPVHFLSGF